MSSNIFVKVWHGIEKVGTFLWSAEKEIPKLIHAAEDVKTVAPTLIAETAVIIGDVKDIVVTGGEDAAEFLTATKALWATVLTIYSTRGANVAFDLSIIPQIQNALVNAKTFENEIARFEKLFTDFLPLYKSIEAGLKQVGADLVISAPAPVEVDAQGAD